MSTFSLQNDYGWLTIDVNTGAITATSTDLISGRFPVVVVEDDAGTITNHNTEVVVYGPAGSTALQTNANPLTSIDHGVQVATSNAFFFTTIPKSPSSTEYKTLAVYRRAYGTVPADMVIIDNELNTVTQSVNTLYEYQWNGIQSQRTDEWKNYWRGGSTASGIHISSFDPATDTITYDVCTVAAGFGGQSVDNIDPITRDYVLYASDGTYGRVGKLNTSTNVFTDVASFGNPRVDPRIISGAVGQDAYYCSLGRDDPNVELWSISKDGLTTSVVAATVDNLGDIECEQLRGGVRATFTDVVGYADGDYYIYNDLITPVASGVPWTPVDALWEGVGSEIPLADGALLSDYWTNSITSNGDVSARIMIGGSGGTVTNYNFNVTTFPYPLINVMQSSPNSVVVSGMYYTGYVEYNLDTLSAENSFAASTSRVEMLRLTDGRLVHGGYPSQITYVYDPVLNTETFLGYLGGDNGPTRGHYYQGMCEDPATGLVYGSGVQYRVGDSGTMGWFDPTDQASFDLTADGFSGETDARLIDYGLNNCVLMGDKIAVSSYIIVGKIVTEALVFMFDIATKTFDPVAWSVGTDVLTSGWIVKVSDTDIFGMTALPNAENNVVFYRMNIVTGDIVYKTEYLGLRTLFFQDRFQQEHISIELSSDGYVYVTTYSDGTAFYLIRINPEIGGVELLGQTAGTDQLILMDGTDDIFLAEAAGNLKEMKSASLVDVMPKAVLVPGAEVFPDPDFTTYAGYFLNGGWAVNTILGKLIRTAEAGASIADVKGMVITNGVTYRVTFTIDEMTGSNGLMNPVILGNTRYNLGVGTHTFDVVASADWIRFYGDDNEQVVIDSVSVKPLVNGLI